MGDFPETCSLFDMSRNFTRFLVPLAMVTCYSRNALRVGGAGRGRKLIGRKPVNLIVGWSGRFLFFVVPRQFSQDIGEWPENQILISDWTYFHCPAATLVGKRWKRKKRHLCRGKERKGPLRRFDHTMSLRAVGCAGLVGLFFFAGLVPFISVVFLVLGGWLVLTRLRSASGIKKNHYTHTHAQKAEEHANDWFCSLLCTGEVVEVDLAAEPLLGCSTMQLAAMVRSGQVTSSQLVETFITQIEKVNPKVVPLLPLSAAAPLPQLPS